MDIFNEIFENDIFRFLFILLLSVLIAFLARIILRTVLKPLAKRTKTKIDDLIIKSLSNILFYIVLVIGIRIGIQHFEMTSDFLPNIIDTILILAICFLLIRIINDFSKMWLKEWKNKTKTTADERLIPILKEILKAMVVVLALFFIFTTWNINITPLLTTAGIAGLALGLAVKDSLNNILGGIQLVLDKTFKVGDKVKLDTGELGVILDIGLRSTKLKTYDNEVIFIPNGNLANTKIMNYTQPDFSIRVNVNFGVEYGSDPEKVRQVVLKTVKQIEGVLEDPEPVVQFLNMSDYSLDFVARVWVKEYTDAYGMKLKATDSIYLALGRENIGIPFPTRTVYTKDSK
jgi:MscS family membrane protein